MPLKLDQVDVRLLNALCEDGRRSLRELARIVGVSTPTVEARLRKIMQTGMISRIAPIFNIEKLDSGVTMLLALKVEASRLDDAPSEIAKIPEVKSVFVTTGDANLLVKVVAGSYEKIEFVISGKIGSMQGVSLLSTQVVTKAFKDEQGVLIEPEAGIRLRCDYCKREITGDPSILKLQNGDRFFCCGTCLQAYKEKYHLRTQRQT